MKSSPAAMERLMTEWLLRFFAVLIYGIAVSNITRALWIDPTRWTLIALLVTEAYALVLLICARRAAIRDTSSVALIATLYSVFYYVLFDTGRTTQFIPEVAGVGFYVVGTFWQFAAKVLLGRSFGLLPAQRGVVISGPYRFVRHPMYLGYLIGQLGFLLVNFSWRNLAVVVGIYLALGLRIVREEAVLSRDDRYRGYQQRVRWRLVPYVF